MMGTVNGEKTYSTKKVSLSYIKRYLKNAGLEVKRDGDSCYVCLAQEKDLLIRWKRGVLSVAVALSVADGEMETASIIANATMLNTDMTKVFLVSNEEEGTNLWFAIETICMTREHFEEMFGLIFKQLLRTVKKYVDFRHDVEKVMRDEAVVSFIMDMRRDSPPS